MLPRAVQVVLATDQPREDTAGGWARHRCTKCHHCVGAVAEKDGM